MTLRGLTIGIAVWLPATLFASTIWGQSHPNRAKPSQDASFDIEPLDYSQEIRKSLDRLDSETERLAIGHIIADLDTKSTATFLV